MPPRSKAQARYIGMLAGRGIGWAHEYLRGAKLKTLPARVRGQKRRRRR
jgi:hypothetical protein